jgi:hypothetical protein
MIVRKSRLMIVTANRNATVRAKSITYQRFPWGVEDGDRDSDSTFPVNSELVSGIVRGQCKMVDEYRPYTSVLGVSSLAGTGLRVSVNDKDRTTDEMQLSVSVEYRNADALR